MPTSCVSAVNSVRLRKLLAGGLGDSKIDDLGQRRRVVMGDQHVGWLEVAVNDPFLVSVLNSLADLNEQVQAFADGQLVLVAIVGDRDAANQLHHEIGTPRSGGAGVEDTGNMRMVHEGQGLALGLEAGNHLFAIHAGLDDLQRQPPADGLSLLGQEHQPHAALADLLEQLIGTNLRARPLNEGDGKRLKRSGQTRSTCFEELTSRVGG